MSRRARTLGPEYFDSLYAKDADPWKFATSDYERAKYAQTLAALPSARYARALEVGCSIGVLTRSLAQRCDRLVAVDASELALSEARRRCIDCGNVEFSRMFVPRDWPQNEFDLILLSEVVYYLDADDVAKLAVRVAGSLAPKAAVALVHWTGETDYPLAGDDAAELFIAGVRAFADPVRLVRLPEYRVDILVGR